MEGREIDVRLTEREYEQLRRATETYREELVIRLCGEVGLRTAEIPRLRPADIVGEGGEGRTRYFLTVRESDGKTRTAYLPAAVAHDFWQYVRSNGIGTEQPVVDVSTRRVQMLVDEISERAAAQTGRAVFDRITPSSLRRYFARQLLVTHGVDARVVAAIGGWEGVDGILRTLDSPTRDEIAGAFEQLEDRGGEQTGRLTRIVEVLESVDSVLINAGSREEIERETCVQLTDDLYRAAWVTTRDGQADRITTRAHAGESEHRFDGPSSTDLVWRTLQTNRTLVAPDEPGPASNEEGRGLLAAVPISHGETSYGVLVVRAGSHTAFEDPERTALTTLGRRIAFAISATERKQLVMGGTVLELTFKYDDSTATLVSLANTLGGTLTLEGVVPGEGNTLLCFVEIDGAETADALEAASETAGIENARLIEQLDDGAFVELLVSGTSPALVLTERGGTVTDLRVENGSATLVGEMSPDIDVRGLYDELERAFPSTELRSKKEQPATEQPHEMRGSLEEQLTDKQHSVLEGAYHAGYFQWPRGSTAEELAESMGVSSPTLHNHLRKAQQRLLETVFED